MPLWLPRRPYPSAKRYKFSRAITPPCKLRPGKLETSRMFIRKVSRSVIRGNGQRRPAERSVPERDLMIWAIGPEHDFSRQLKFVTQWVTSTTGGGGRRRLFRSVEGCSGPDLTASCRGVWPSRTQLFLIIAPTKPRSAPTVSQGVIRARKALNWGMLARRRWGTARVTP